MLVDTTIWVDHLRRGDAVLIGLLQHLQVTVHPFIFLETKKLMGRGLGWVDVHLLVSAEAVGEKLLTRDRRLKVAAESLGLA